MQLGTLEHKIMRYIWRFPADRLWTVRDILTGLSSTANHPYAYTTILTVMTHLAAKKLLERKRVSRQYVYSVRLSEADVVSQLTQGFLSGLRKQYGLAGLVQFVDTVEEDLDPAVLARAKKILGKK